MVRVLQGRGRSARSIPARVMWRLSASTQLVVEIHMEYPYSLGEWKIESCEPFSGGGISQDVSFFVTEGAFAANPFLISLTPADGCCRRTVLHPDINARISSLGR